MSFHSPRLIWLHWAPVWHHLLRRPTIHFFSKLITLDPSTLEKAVHLDWIHTSSMGFPFPPTKSLVLGLQNLIHQHGISHYDSWLRVPLYSKAVDTILWDLLIEESSCWLKTWFFRPGHKRLQRHYLAGLAGKSCPPHTRVGTQPMHCNLWQEAKSRTQTPLAVFIHLHSFIRRSRYLRL